MITQAPVVPTPSLTELAERLKSQGVGYLLPTYVDMHGISKSKMVPLDHFERMAGGSELYTGAALEGVPQDVSDEEVASVPDLGSCRVLPWNKEVAWFASDLWCAGQAFDACSRNILKRARARLAEHGLGMHLGMEAEFFVLRDTADGGFKPLSNRQDLAKPAYDTARLMDNFPWLAELVGAMNQLGYGVYSLDHEDGIGQFEVDFAYFDALTMADNFVFLRWMAHEIAQKHGGFASFMPKPYMDRAGSGAHFNMSLYDLATQQNRFVPATPDPRGCGLSKLGYQFIAGVLRHLPAICAVVAPTVNSYKRLILQGSMSSFTWAPVFCCYGNNNRTNTLRVPLGGGRVELRAADSSCNPYLGAAMVMMAGLEGIEQDLDPGEPHYANMYLKSPAELAELGIDTLPRTLGEAVECFAADPLAETVFGPTMHKAWIDYKRHEWLSYLNHVADWEYQRYLKMF